MSAKANLITTSNQLDLALLMALQENLAPFTLGEPLFWDDLHIFKGMPAVN